jgi:ABC-type amino acid transport substrate-binding protein
MRFRLLGPTLLSAALTLLATSAFATAPLRVLLNDVAPYTLHDDSHRPGMHWEIMAALSQHSQIGVELSAAPYVRLAMSLKENRSDLVVGVDGPELQALGHAVGVFHAFQFVVLSKKTSGIFGLSQLKGKVLGVARGAYYDDRINNEESIKKYELVDPFQGVRMLSLDRIDAVISSDYLLSYALRQTGVDATTFSAPFTVNEKSYVLYARKDLGEKTIRTLQRSLKAMHKSGQISTILRTYQSH